MIPAAAMNLTSRFAVLPTGRERSEHIPQVAAFGPRA
jgi:hypothetical protein